MENKIMKINVSFDSAGLKLAGHLYAPSDEANPRGTSSEKSFPHNTLASGFEAKGAANE
jgi:hypothetical protein